MVQLMEQVALQWEEDEERFRKLQLSDLTAFNDRVDALTVYTVNQSISMT